MLRGCVRLVFLLALLLVVLQSSHAAPRNAHQNGKNKQNKNNVKAPPVKAKPVKLNVDILPPLQTVLEELQLSSYLRNFVRMGVSESRLLLKLSAMDFQIMRMDWDDFNADKLLALKTKIDELYRMAVVPEEEVRPELEERKRLVYGRVYVPDGVQSFEYSLASFGGAVPLGEQRLVLASSIYECNATEPEDYHGAVVVVKRGNCTFLHKALSLKAKNAHGMLAVSFEDRLESPSSGYGVNKTISEELVQSLGEFFTIQTANTTWESLQRVVQFREKENRTAAIHIVPLKCHTGGHCNPLTREEQALQGEVSWGRLRFSSGDGECTSESKESSRCASESEEGEEFDFITSNFGAHLPVGLQVPVVAASSPFACESLNNISTSVLKAHARTGVAMLAQRGECRFDVKALHAQNAGARVLILFDPLDKALQRIGGMLPELPFVGIPTILTTPEAAKRLADGRSRTVEFLPAKDNSGLENWLEIAHTEWSEVDDERRMQLVGLRSKFEEKQSRNILRWLDRRLRELEADR